MFVTKKNCVSIAQQIVDKYYRNILKELNVPEIKIDIKEDFSDKVGHMGYFTCAYTRNLFDIFETEITVIPEESFIVIHVPEHLYKAIAPKTRIRTVFFSKQFEKLIVNTLTHECRHLWQHIYNEHRDSAFDRMLISYQRLESEVDAREFSKLYLSKLLSI